MSTAATVISNVGTHNWNARVYDTLALASRLAAAVKDRSNVLRLAYRLHDLNKTVAQFVGIVDSAMNGDLKPDPNGETVTPETLRSNADNFEQLYHTLDYIAEGSRRAGLTNNSLTAASIRGLQKNLDAIANLADWFDLAAQPEAVNQIFETAKQERERGELIDLARVD